jgi:ubiquinone/menaquinone biosynthesis C-methylase UbiE
MAEGGVKLIPGATYPSRESMPNTSISFDRIAEDYDRTRRIPPEVMEETIAALSEALGTRERVLEIGVGTGRIALPLIRRGYRVVGVDVGPKMLGRAVAKGLEDGVLGDAMDLPFRDRGFQGAVAVHVLDLLPDWRRAVAEAARVTEDVFVTAAKKTVASPPILARYRELLGPAGDGRESSLKPLEDLVTEVRPIRDVFLPEYEVVIRVRKLLEGLDGRLVSFQWEIPEEVHRGIMESLRSEFGDEEEMREANTVRVTAWRAEDLRAAYMRGAHAADG